MINDELLETILLSIKIEEGGNYDYNDVFYMIDSGDCIGIGIDMSRGMYWVNFLTKSCRYTNPPRQCQWVKDRTSSFEEPVCFESISTDGVFGRDDLNHIYPLYHPLVEKMLLSIKMRSL